MLRPLDLAVVETRADFLALESEWNDLFDRAGLPIQVFQTFNWCWHWSNHFLRETGGLRRQQLFIVTGRRHGRLVLVWPLVMSRDPGFTRLTALGEPVSQYSDLLVDNLDDKDDVLDAAWSLLASRFAADALYVRRARADGHLAPLLARQGANLAARYDAPYLDLASAPDFATYEQRYTAKARKNRRRFLRRFEERGPAVLTTCGPGPRASELARLAIHMKRAWLKARGMVSPALADQRTLAFFADVAASVERPVGCAFTSLDSLGEPTAIEISFDCKGHRAVHLIVYALKFERTSAGQLMIERSLKTCFDAGIAAYDMLTPADSYKLEWADGVVAANDWTQAWSAKGRLYTDVFIARVRPWVKTLVNRATQTLSRMRAPRHTKDAID